MPQRSIVIAAVQLPFAWAVSPQEYFDRMHAPIAEAARRGAKLVVLPQYTGDMLVGLQVPGEPTAGFAEVAAQAGFATWHDCVRATSATTAEFYIHTFESLAKRYQIHLVAGTISLPGEVDGSTDTTPPIYHAAFLFGPEGDVLGEQRQLFAAELEDPATRYGRGLTPVETELGRMAMVVGDDALHPDVAASILTHGCALVANPMARYKPADRESAMGQWRALGAVGIYVVEAAVVGRRFVGWSALYGPVDGRASPTRVLVQAAADEPLAQVIDAVITPV